MQASQLRIHAFRLKPGQDLKGEIDAYVQKKQIQAGFIMTCVGSLAATHIRFANRPEGQKDIGHFEIISLVGTVSTNGGHLHIALSDRDGKTTGGHLLEGNLVYTTAEIILGEIPGMIFRREKDGTTSWPELQIIQVT